MTGGGGSIRFLLLPAAVPRAASALFDASSKVLRRRLRMWTSWDLPPSCFDKSIETRGECSALCNPETRCHICSWPYWRQQQQFITSWQHSATSWPRQRCNSALRIPFVLEAAKFSSPASPLAQETCSARATIMPTMVAPVGAIKVASGFRPWPNTRKLRFAIDPLSVAQSAAAAAASTARKPKVTALWLRAVSSPTLSATFGSLNLSWRTLD
jgi:hypothetical protein